jgi:glycosyltransferase involved in cell wall biosynthesis
MRWLSFSAAHLEDSLGGTEVYVRRLATSLGRRGVDVTLGSYGSVPGVREVDGLSLVTLPGLPAPLTRWQRWGCEPFRLAEFDALLDSLRPDVVHLNSSLQANPPEFLGAARQRGARVLWTYHAPGNTCLQTALLREGREPCDGLVEARRCARCTLVGSGMPGPLATAAAAFDWGALSRLAPATARHPLEVRRGTERFRVRLAEALRSVDLHLTHSAWSREVLARNGVAASALMHLSLPPPALDGWPASAAMNSQVGPYRLLFAGRLIDVKGLHVLAAALEGPLQGDRDLLLTVLGAPGPVDYERRVRGALSGDTRVTFRDAVTPAATLAAMAEADAVVIPSTWPETGPYTLVEAQGTGAAVVGSDRGGIVERLRDDPLGFLFPSGDPEGLARAIRRAREKRLGAPLRAERATAFRAAYQARFEAELDALLAALAAPRA